MDPTTSEHAFRWGHHHESASTVKVRPLATPTYHTTLMGLLRICCFIIGSNDTWISVLKHYIIMFTAISDAFIQKYFAKVRFTVINLDVGEWCQILTMFPEGGAREVHHPPPM